MECEFTMEEIISGNLSNNEKIKMLYLQYDKPCEEISRILGLAEGTVRNSISNGGYCKTPRRVRNESYGDISARLNQLYSEHPNITAAEAAVNIGCRVQTIYRYAKKMGIVFDGKRSEHIGSTDIAEEILPISKEDIHVGTSGKLQRKIQDEGAIKKPYIILEWPFVEYNGKIYEVLTKRKLRKCLLQDFNI